MSSTQLMSVNPQLVCESQRLAALYHYQILDTKPEAGFDDLTTLASNICKAPIAFVTMVDACRHWFKSRVGLDLEEIPRGNDFCSNAILQNDVFIVPNALEDERFASLPSVAGEPGIRFYAGMPLVNPEGYAVGTICVMDVVPRILEPQQIETMQALGRQTVAQLELRKKLIESNILAEESFHREKELQVILEKLKATQTQMIQTEKMSSLGTLVAGIAHEINNPVNFICGNLEHVHQVTQDLMKLALLYRQEVSDPSSETQQLLHSLDLDFLEQDLPTLFDAVQFGVERIQEIVSALRNFSRVDKAEFESTDIHKLMDSTLLLLENRLKENLGRPEITLIRDYGNLPLVDCYPGPLNQVFMNILTNAIDALDQKYDEQEERECCNVPGQITIKTVLADNDWVKIAIADNGLGIPKEVQQKIFDPFFTTKPVGKGTGLGMSISYQIIVQRHGGMLEAYSHPESGTEFVIQIPVRRET
ncbi:MAG: ATP-binding protein [Leptolyngbyaceae bacterium]|nr:ATP-binding protein [Leptolyngbyaceae bacterium]